MRSPGCFDQAEELTSRRCAIFVPDLANEPLPGTYRCWRLRSAKRILQLPSRVWDDRPPVIGSVAPQRSSAGGVRALRTRPATEPVGRFVRRPDLKATRIHRSLCVLQRQFHRSWTECVATLIGLRFEHIQVDEQQGLPAPTGIAIPRFGSHP